MNRGVALLLVTGLLAGCGSGSSGSSGAESRLRQDVHDVTDAVAGHDREAARSALAKLTADAQAARAAGQITDSKLAAIRSAAAAVTADLAPPATPSAPASSPAPAPSASPPGDGGKGDGKDKGGKDGGKKKGGDG